MTHHTYLALMTIIRLVKGIVSTCETWVRTEHNGSDVPSKTTTDRHLTEE